MQRISRTDGPSKLKYFDQSAIFRCEFSFDDTELSPVGHAQAVRLWQQDAIEARHAVCHARVVRAVRGELVPAPLLSHGDGLLSGARLALQAVGREEGVEWEGHAQRQPTALVHVVQLQAPGTDALGGNAKAVPEEG